MQPVTPRPWGLTRMRPHGPADVMPHATARLDPATQTAVYYDVHGRLVTGKHAKTQPATEKREATGGDRQGGPPPDERRYTVTDEDEG